MGYLFKNVNNILVTSRTFGRDFMRFTYYVKENGRDRTVEVTMRNGIRPPSFKTIEQDSNKFVNGFKVVLMTTGEYAYVRESDNFLLPYRYDVATDFNEYGYAMVGKDGTVSWINKEFEYLNSEGKMIKEHISQNASARFIEPTDYIYTPFDGWLSVQTFSNSSNPLSEMWNGEVSPDHVYICYYFGTDGKIKDFYKYNGEVDKEYNRHSFAIKRSFNEKGYAITEDYSIIFDKGYFVPYDYLVKLCDEMGILNGIVKEAQVDFNNKGKVLKKKYK